MPTPTKGGKAIALGIGGGPGAAGAGVGIGVIFDGVIQSVARRPEMRDELTQIQWMGFGLTEACFFYGLVAGLIAFFLWSCSGTTPCGLIVRSSAEDTLKPCEY